MKKHYWLYIVWYRYKNYGDYETALFSSYKDAHDFCNFVREKTNRDYNADIEIVRVREEAE